MKDRFSLVFVVFLMRIRLRRFRKPSRPERGGERLVSAPAPKPGHGTVVQGLTSVVAARRMHGRYRGNPSMMFVLHHRPPPRPLHHPGTKTTSDNSENRRGVSLVMDLQGARSVPDRDPRFPPRKTDASLHPPRTQWR